MLVYSFFWRHLLTIQRIAITTQDYFCYVSKETLADKEKGKLTFFTHINFIGISFLWYRTYIWRVTTDFYCLGVRIWAQRNHIVIIFHSYYLQCVNNNLPHTPSTSILIMILKLKINTLQNIWLSNTSMELKNSKQTRNLLGFWSHYNEKKLRPE